MKLDELRAELALADGVRFLNFAATAPMLRSAAEAMVQIARQGVRPLGEHFTAWLGVVESARRRVADAIGARIDEVTFTTNTSTALSLAAAAVRWRPGDRVLYPADEFPSNRFVWDNLREMGVRSAPIAPEAGVGFVEQLAASDLSGVRMVALSAVSYRDGRRLDVEAVCRLCRERGILVTVDAIQAVGATPVDARAWGCDFLACGGQKWLLGPVGSGFLFVARERLEELHVPTVGWASSRHAGNHDAPALEWTAGASRFEAGLPDVAAIAGLAASVEKLAEVGWERVFETIAAHRAQLAEAAAARGWIVKHDGLPGAHAGIVTLAASEDRLDVLANALGRRRVIATRRPRDIRFAVHATTSDDEIGAVVDALGEASHRSATTPRAKPASPAALTPPVSAAQLPWRRAIVTGASRGLGAAIAAELAARGCALTLIGRDAAALAAVRDVCRAWHVDIETAVLDLSDSVALADWIAGAADHLRAIDLLVNNAARADASRFLDADPTAERAALETNFFAPVALARAVLPGMAARGRGAILNVVTTGARNALPLFSAYAASKGALWAWGESLGRELGGVGVTVTTFLPPHMDSATSRQLGRRAIAFYDMDAGMTTNAGRVSSPSEIVRVARRALDAAASGRPLVAPVRARWELLLNVVAPRRMIARIRTRWKG